MQVQKLMTDYYVPEILKFFGYSSVTESWHCCTCGVDMGKNNPRQLCKKSYCENE